MDPKKLILPGALLSLTVIGNAATVRAEIIQDHNKSSLSNTEAGKAVATPTPGSKAGEGKCGEGKCGSTKKK